jgi:Ca2+-binding RTX toxin-like protein
LQVYSANGQPIDPAGLSASAVIGADILLEAVFGSLADPVTEPEPVVVEPVPGDILQGGLGNDRFTIDSPGDVIVNEIGFSQGGGIDTVESWISYTLPANIEILRLQGTADINGTGGFAPEALVGQAGDNVLDGGGGNDVITAKAGDDTLIGGLGADTLVGDEGADVFKFNATSESRAGQAGRDFINGFANGEDRIDLSAIDANIAQAGTQFFVFIGTETFGGSAGELRYFTFGGGNFNIVEADVNGDRVADMQIFVNLTDTMAAGDFIL